MLDRIIHVELSGRSDPIRDLRLHHHQRRQRDKLGLPDKSAGRGNDERRNLPGDRRNLLPDRRKQYHQFPDRQDTKREVKPLGDTEILMKK